MGVFRIAHAEFIKIFKKPSVYIMGVILAAVLVLSLLFFDPVGKQSYAVNITGTTVGQVYNKFTNDSSSPYKKSDFDAEINKNLSKVDFYLILNQRNDELNKVNIEFATLFSDLQKAVSSKDTDENITKIFSDIKTKINKYKTIYNDVTALTDASKFYNNYINLSTYTTNNTLLDKIITDSSESPSSFVNRVTNNKYLDKLNDIPSKDRNAIKNSISDFITDINTKLSEYSHLVLSEPMPSYEAQYMQKLNELKTVVINAQNHIKLLVENDYPLVFIEKSEYESISKTFTYVISQLNSFSDPNNSNSTLTNHERHKLIVKNVESSNLNKQLTKFNDKLAYIKINSKTLETLKTTINETIYKLRDGVNESIETCNKEASSSDLKKISNIKDLITSYRVLSINTTTLVDNTINIEAVNPLNTTKINQYLNYDNFNLYEAKENLTRVNYYISNGVYNQHYADVFSFNKNSTTETNAYDFMFYAMKIATVLISAFSILMAASLMSAEYDSGTIKLLAIRPFKRWKIITGKLFATMFFVLVFILFSFLISFVAGVCLYPLSSTPVLTVLNAQVAFSIHPMVLMLIYLGSIILEVFFYAVLALSISTIFRSFTGAISISFITFILAFSLNILFGGALWYSFIPFINTDFFKYFGGSFLSTQTGLLNQLFAPTLLSNASIFISLGIYFGTVLILLLLTHIIFKARDF